MRFLQQHCPNLNRRQMLARTSCGFGALALSSLINDKAFASQLPSEGQTPLHGLHHSAKAKSVIWLFMNGGPSHVDTWDYNSTSSLTRDVWEGKPSEIEYQNGTVVKLGEKYGIETPVNSFVYTSILPRELKARGIDLREERDKE